MIIYVFAVTITQAIVDHLPPEDDQQPEALVAYWGSVDVSMMTLFQAITGGESWRFCWTVLMDFYPAMAAFLTVYVAFTYFAVLNVLTGVFCSSAIEATQRNPDII